ncbi:MAG: hypothetical protein R3308_02575, partial [Thiohalobacterales bacterium]|nr:hypothetical protein [Thiohalobacterales bacterium]
MLTAHLPALQVAIPLISAPLCLLLSRPHQAWALALLVSGLVLGISISIALQVQGGEALSYAIGAWAAPLGIEYRIDMAGALMSIIIAGIGVVAML